MAGQNHTHGCQSNYAGEFRILASFYFCSMPVHVSPSVYSHAKASVQLFQSCVSLWTMYIIIYLHCCFQWDRLSAAVNLLQSIYSNSTVRPIKRTDLVGLCVWVHTKSLGRRVETLCVAVSTKTRQEHTSLGPPFKFLIAVVSHPALSHTCV